jgi:uncharacterized protein (TIGR00661 family)
MRKILFYSVNGVGLGHLNRTTVIASTIRKINSSVQIKIITSAKHTYFIEKSKFKFIKIPSVGTNQLLNIAKNWKIQKSFIRTVNNFQPDVLVYDTHFPGEILYHKNIKNRINILIMRALKPYHFINAMLQSQKIFDMILIPHNEMEIKEMLDSTFINIIRRISNIKYTGPIIRINDINIPDGLNKYNIGENDFVIVVTVGGGGSIESHGESPRKILENIKISSKALHEKIDNLKIICISGPYMNRKIRKILQKNPFIINVDFEPNFIQLIHSANLVISTPGYNTCNEIIYTKTPSILIPTNKSVEDTLQRAQKFSRMGISVIIKRLSPHILRNVILQIYKNKIKKMKESFKNIELNIGNDNMAQEILHCKRVSIIDKKVNSYLLLKAVQKLK